MADAIVSGTVGITNRARFSSFLNCDNSAPSGSISGRITVNTNRGRISYDFRSNSPSRINAQNFGNTNNVVAVFGRVTLVNRSNGNVTNNARLTLNASRNINGNRRASLTISRPFGNTLRASGSLRNGRVVVFNDVSCQLLL